LHEDGEIDAEAVSIIAALENRELRPSNSLASITVKSRRLNQDVDDLLNSGE